MSATRTTEPQRTARYGVHLVVRRLKAHGLSVCAVNGPGNGALVNGYRVEIRVGRQVTVPHYVTSRGKGYVYTYQRTHFNCHRHGKPVTPVPDFWVFIDLTDGQMSIIPASVLHGKTLTRHIGLRASRDIFTQYRDRYDLLKIRKRAAA